MKLVPLLPPVLAACAAAYLCLPPVADAWETTGWRLGIGQRDFRVFNNFGDPEANDNQTAHPNFPGRFGADMAIWKASVEWGSELHGDGEGDPHQPAGLGSGGANFDATFQGSHDKAGNIGDNIHSELAGCAGGVIAFTQSFIDGSGWRTFYYECWIFVDGPDIDWPTGVGKYDLQGIATHEYGHALGLGHSPIDGSTMFATPTDGKAWRSLHPDDIGGVQAIYGVKQSGKPRITGASLAGSLLTIDGAQFDPTENQVWFRRAGFGNGDPVIVPNQPSLSAGTRIEVSVPAAAGSGDVLVRSGLTGRGETLSNAWPIDLGCPPAVSYCTTSPNSVGRGAMMAMTGSQSVAANDLVLHSVGSPAGEFGLFIYSDAPGQFPVGDGVLCLGGPVSRLPAVAVDGVGRASFALDLTNPPPGGQITAGTTWYFQWWYRDTAAAGSGSNFSDGLEIGFCE